MTIPTLNAKTLRMVRWVQVAGLILSAAELARGLLLPEYRGSALLAAIFIVFWTGLICMQTALIHRRERLERPRPDYSAIAAMEREVYGETFEHDGGPETAPPVAALFKPGGLITREDAGAFETLAALRRERKANCKLCDRMEREHHSNLRWERPS